MGLMNYVGQLIQRPQIVPGETVGQWNGGVASSGQPGADLITIGVAGQWYRLNQFTAVLDVFNIGATITVREYMVVAGAERLILEDDYGPPPPEVAFMSWWFDAEFFGPYRVELFSDQAADDGLIVPYEYRIKAW